MNAFDGILKDLSAHFLPPGRWGETFPYLFRDVTRKKIKKIKSLVTKLIKPISLRWLIRAFFSLTSEWGISGLHLWEAFLSRRQVVRRSASGYVNEMLSASSHTTMLNCLSVNIGSERLTRPVALALQEKFVGSGCFFFCGLFVCLFVLEWVLARDANPHDNWVSFKGDKW